MEDLRKTTNRSPHDVIPWRGLPLRLEPRKLGVSEPLIRGACFASGSWRSSTWRTTLSPVLQARQRSPIVSNEGSSTANR